MMRHLLCPLLLIGVVWAQQSAPPASSTQAMYDAAARSAQTKFDRIKQNAGRSSPDQTPTTLTENEINAWLASGRVQLPKGVKKLQFRGTPGIINATAIVDFDEITAGRGSFNPLLALFSGTHRVEATARAQGSGGEGHVNVESASLDGVEIPRRALEFFIDRYIKPKHPEIGLDTMFKLPYKIDSASVESHQLVLLQK
ncbi:MAG TPA: hypothetical protein VG897_17160 [Terriglobales bacterium]|nr:hypothetical protein [Terriglobales bacterium]